MCVSISKSTQIKEQALARFSSKTATKGMNNDVNNLRCRELATLEWSPRFMPSWTELNHLFNYLASTVSFVSQDYHDDLRKRILDFKKHQKHHLFCLLAGK